MLIGVKLNSIDFFCKKLQKKVIKKFTKQEGDICKLKKFEIKAYKYGGVSMKLRKFLFCSLLVSVVLLAAGCENGINNGNYEKKEEVSIYVVVEAYYETASCSIYTSDNSNKYDNAIIMVNEIKLDKMGVPQDWDEDSLFYKKISGLNLAVHEEVTIKISHPELPFIEEIYEIPDYPKNLQANRDLKDLLKENVDKVTLSWEDVGCDEYRISINKTYHAPGAEKPIQGGTTRWIKDNSIDLTSKDLDIYDVIDGELVKIADADTVTINIFGVNGQDKPTTYGRLNIRVYSPERASLTASTLAED